MYIMMLTPARKAYSRCVSSGGTVGSSGVSLSSTAHAPAKSLAVIRIGETPSAAAAGLLALKGHKALGGMRASIYNAVPLEAVQVLVQFMKDFAKRHG